MRHASCEPNMGKTKLDRSVPLSFKQKHRKNKQNKTVLMFDETARKCELEMEKTWVGKALRAKKRALHENQNHKVRLDSGKMWTCYNPQIVSAWLTGFSKRKTERRKRAQHEEIERLKEEKRRIKKEKRDERAKQLSELRAAVRGDEEEEPTEMEALAKPTIYDMSTHTVTVVDVTDTDFIGSSGLHLGFNNTNTDKEHESEPEEKASQTEADDEDKTEETSSEAVFTSKKRPSSKTKRKGKPHKNLTHLMDKRSLAKKGRAKIKDDQGNIYVRKHKKIQNTGKKPSKKRHKKPKK